jgi:hypothetical protein
MAISTFEKNGQKLEVPTEALGKAMSDVSGGYVTGQTEQQRLESLGYKLLSPYSGDKIVDGASNIRTDINTIDTNLSNITPAGYDFNNTDFLSGKEKEMYSQYESLSRSEGSLTAQDLADIEAEAINAGRAYDPLISEATESKRKGMPKAVISAGERGGFMSTQMAGVSALAQTEGGDWIGAGGELENIKSVYDTNIQNLETAKLRAIEEARAAAKQAKLTGKREDTDRAREALKFYQEANLKQLQIGNEKVAAISNWEKLQSDKKKANLSQISDLAMLNMGLTPDLVQQIDSLYGQGYAQKYYEVSKAAKEAQSVEDSIKLEKDLYDLLSKVPTGTKIKIGDATYEGLGASGNYQIFSESDTRGTTYVTFDKNTGKRVSVDFLAGVGAVKPTTPSGSKESYFTRPVDGVTKYFYGAENNWQNAQELTPEEYRKGVSSAANTMPEAPITYDEIVADFQAMKDVGKTKSEAPTEFFKRWGGYDEDAKRAFEEVYGGSFNLKDWISDTFSDFATIKG